MYFVSFQDLFKNILLDLSKKVSCYKKAFKYLRYKKNFLDHNPKKKVFRIEKKIKKLQNYFFFNSPQNNFLSDLV